MSQCRRIDHNCILPPHEQHYYGASAIAGPCLSIRSACTEKLAPRGPFLCALVGKVFLYFCFKLALVTFVTDSFMVRFLVFFNSWPLAAWKSHRSHLIFLPSWTTFLWSLRLSLWAKFIPQESHLYWTPSCLVLMCNLNELCPVELKLQRSQLYLSPSCCTFIWLLRVFWSAVVYDIARTLFICLYAYCLCGFEGNIEYST